MLPAQSAVKEDRASPALDRRPRRYFPSVSRPSGGDPFTPRKEPQHGIADVLGRGLGAHVTESLGAAVAHPVAPTSISQRDLRTGGPDRGDRDAGSGGGGGLHDWSGSDPDPRDP